MLLAVSHLDRIGEGAEAALVEHAIASELIQLRHGLHDGLGGADKLIGSPLRLDYSPAAAVESMTMVRCVVSSCRCRCEVQV